MHARTAVVHGNAFSNLSFCEVASARARRAIGANGSRCPPGNALTFISTLPRVKSTGALRKMLSTPRPTFRMRGVFTEGVGGACRDHGRALPTWASTLPHEHVAQDRVWWRAVRSVKHSVLATLCTSDAEGGHGNGSWSEPSRRGLILPIGPSEELIAIDLSSST